MQLITSLRLNIVSLCGYSLVCGAVCCMIAGSCELVAGEPIAGDEARAVHVILLAGQSNMAGAGNYNDLSADDKQRVKNVADRVLLSDNGGPAKPLSFRVTKGGKRDYDEQFGPEIFIGLTFAEANLDREYLLIKYAMGGTSLYGAWNPQWSDEQSLAVEKGARKQQAKLYSQHVEAISKNLAHLDQQGKRWKIVSMAWMQGENDAAHEVSARSYEANLTKLIAAYRSEFKVPTLPLVCGQINSEYGEFDQGPDIVRAAFIRVADADPNVAVIETMKARPPTDFPKVDGAHYNAEGQKRLGTAMAHALIEMQ